jgi:hypothetical protein
VAAFLAAVPLAFTSSAVMLGVAGFFFAWLDAFMVVLLAVGRGPLDPSLAVLHFLFTAALPIELKHGGAGRPNAAGLASSRSRARALSIIISCSVKVAVIAALLRVYHFKDQLNFYARPALYDIHIYCFADLLLLPCITAAGRVLSMELEPQFDRPYMASSLRDF